MTSINGRGIQFQHLNTEQSTQRTERGENTTENRVLDANNAEDLNAENLEAVDTIQFRAGEGEDIVLLDLSQIPAESRTQFLNELKGRLLAGQADGLNAEEFYDAIGESLDAAEIEPSQDRTSSSRLFVPPVGSSTSHVTLSRSSTGPAIDIPISDNPNDVPRAEIDRENKRVLIVTEERSEFFDIPDVAPSTPDSQQTGRAGEDTLPDVQPTETQVDAEPTSATATIVTNQQNNVQTAMVTMPSGGQMVVPIREDGDYPRGKIEDGKVIVTVAENESFEATIQPTPTNTTPIAQALQSAGEIANVSGLTLEAFQGMNPQEHLNILLKIDETHWRTLLTELTVKQRDDIQDAAQALVRQFNREIATNPPPPPPRSGASSGGVSSGGVSSGGVAPAQPTRRHLSPEEIAAKEATRDKAQRLIQLIEDMRPAPVAATPEEPDNKAEIDALKAQIEALAPTITQSNTTNLARAEQVLVFLNGTNEAGQYIGSIPESEFSADPLPDFVQQINAAREAIENARRLHEELESSRDRLMADYQSAIGDESMSPQDLETELSRIQQELSALKTSYQSAMQAIDDTHLEVIEGIYRSL